MDTYEVRTHDMYGDEWKPQIIRAQSIVTLRKRLMGMAKKSGSYYMSFKVKKVGSKTTDMLEMGWGGGFLWYTNYRYVKRKLEPKPQGGLKWDKVSNVGSDGRLI